MSTETTNNAVATTPRRVGRPQTPVNWPSGQFTINDVQNTGLSRVTLQLRAKAAVGNTLKVVGTTKQTKIGRPATVYERVQS